MRRETRWLTPVNLEPCKYTFITYFENEGTLLARTSTVNLGMPEYVQICSFWAFALASELNLGTPLALAFLVNLSRNEGTFSPLLGGA